MTERKTQHHGKSSTAKGSDGRSAQRSATTHRGSARRGWRSRPIGLNLVAMIDVVFLLLMYFLLSANFTTGEEVYHLDLPDTLGAAVDDPFDLPDQPLEILIATTGPGPSDYRIEVDLRIEPLMDFDGLYQFLSDARVDSETNPGGMLMPDTPLLIRPTKTTRWEHAVDAFNACLRAEYVNVRLVEPGEQ